MGFAWENFGIQVRGGFEGLLIDQIRIEELQRLPEKYRVPLVLCYIDGRTHADVGRAIGLPRGSVAKRIGEGLERFVRKEPLRRVHECVFGVLALESEPVDPRL